MKLTPVNIRLESEMFYVQRASVFKGEQLYSQGAHIHGDFLQRTIAQS